MRKPNSNAIELRRLPTISSTSIEVALEPQAKHDRSIRLDFFLPAISFIAKADSNLQFPLQIETESLILRPKNDSHS